MCDIEWHLNVSKFCSAKEEDELIRVLEILLDMQEGDDPDLDGLSKWQREAIREIGGNEDILFHAAPLSYTKNACGTILEGEKGDLDFFAPVLSVFMREKGIEEPIFFSTENWGGKRKFTSVVAIGKDGWEMANTEEMARDPIKAINDLFEAANGNKRPTQTPQCGM